ncbi:MAG: 6-hydroxymethylpterin diphosphokinase MptE-like protein [Halarcobacter sp.]
MNDLNNLQNTLLEIYQQNTTYLKINYPLIYKKIYDFEKKGIENSYINFENNHFELYIKNKKVYNCDPFYDAKCRAESIKSSNAYFKIIVDSIDDKNLNDSDELSGHSLVHTYLNKIETNSNKKFIFIGTLLGVHLNDIHRIEKQSTYLIVEPNIEIFRLSLFLTDYTEIAKTSKLFFSIEENQKELSQTVEEFLEYKYQDNNLIKFELASEEYIDLISLLKNLLISKNPFIDVYSEDIINIKRALYNLNHTQIPFISFKDNFEKKNIPALILGAGPSLEKYQEFIKKHHKNFYIICASAALKRLAFLDVVPDMVVCIDKKKKEILEQFNVDKKFYETSTILVSSKTNRLVIERILSSKTYMIEISINFIKEVKSFYPVSVGDCMFEIASIFNFSSLYLLGIDAAYSNTLNSHDSLHQQNIQLENMQNSSDYKTTLIKIKGNFKKTVDTSLAFKEIIDRFETLSKTINKKVFNLSDGAYLKNCIPTKIDTIKNKKIEDKSSIQKTLTKELNSQSISKLGKASIENCKKEIVLLKELKKSDEKEFDIILVNLKKEYPESIVLNILIKFEKLVSPYFKATKQKNNINIFHKQRLEVIDYLIKILT